MSTPATWQSEVDRMTAEWVPVGFPLPPLDFWRSEVGRMASEVAGLKAMGVWSRGPHDLLSVVGLQTWELAHSAALGWLCDPEASHGFGFDFLARLLARCDGELIRGPVEVAREESREVEIDGVERTTRADVVVRGNGWTLVVEVKVNAIEQPDQALRLHEGWKNEPGARFIFLTRRGQRPWSAPDVVVEQWTPLGWREVAGFVRAALEIADPKARGRPAVEQYLATLESTM